MIYSYMKIITNYYLERFIALVFGLGLVFLLVGCGEDSPPSFTPDNQEALQNVDTSPYSDQELAPYHKICVEQNMIHVEADLERCLIQDIYSDEFCQIDYDEDVASLDHAWNETVTGSNARLATCLADFRTLAQADFCFATYEVELDFYAGLCKFAI